MSRGEVSLDNLKHKTDHGVGIVCLVLPVGILAGLAILASRSATAP